MFLRRRFSASNFLREVREHDTTCLVYIGELCRYLLNTPEREDDYKNPLGTMMGNGLRPDILHRFKDRYGIVKDCGGDIKAVSRDNEGAVFYVTFPIPSGRKTTSTDDHPHEQLPDGPMTGARETV